jgi:peptidoglycan/LPS O-acetylase OafA/YrhL
MDLLLIIRGLAAISVVIWHTVGYHAGHPLVNVPGRTAVWIFFGISGYVIAYGFVHKRYLLDGLGLKNFYLNRFLRIYPLFLLLSVLGWLTMWADSGQNPLEWMDVPSQFFGLQFDHSYKLNGVFWTLGLEIQFYVVAPVLVMLFLIRNVQKRWLVAAACYVGMLVFNWAAVRYMGWSVDGRNIISVLPHFFTGMAGCGLVASLTRNNAKAAGYLTAALACLVASNWLYHRHPAWFWNTRGTVLIDAMILLFVFAHASLQPPVAIASRMMRTLLWMGTLSYGIYAWHAYLMSSIPWLSTNWVALLLSSVAISYVSYRGVELPALRLKRWQGAASKVGGSAALPDVLPSSGASGLGAGRRTR